MEVDFVRYAERSAGLVNADLADAGRLVDLLEDRSWLQPSVTEKDAGALRRFVRELRPVFEAAGERQDEVVVDLLNVLLAKHPVTPYIAGHGPARGSGGNRWHLHVADRHSSVAELLIGESLLGLSTLVCEMGPTRLGVCDASRCANVFVDISPNQSRRYCSERCSSRANVAAYRARARAGR